MNWSSCSRKDSDEVLAQLLAELEFAAQPEQVLESYCDRYPDRALEFRKTVELGHILDQSTADIDALLPVRLGDFRNLRQIDQGGMGIVCEAIQEPFDRRVVVKIIRHGRTLAESRERFLREQRVLANLHQTHIVPVFAAGDEGPIQYFAMPYIDGVNLQRLIGTARAYRSSCPGDKMPHFAELVETAKASRAAIDTHPLPAVPASRDYPSARTEQPEDDLAHPAVPAAPPVTRNTATHLPTLSGDYFRSVAQIMSDVAESVHHAHEHDIVHRDLKPSNIMVDPEGQSWLIDFGLAGHINGNHARDIQTDRASVNGHPVQTIGPVGTPGYMSPEQVFGQPIGAWTDVWGLGVVLYELSTLQRAFPQQQRTNTADSVGSFRHIPPRELIKDFPHDLAAICEKALRISPSHRYISAQAFADDLKRWLRGEPTVARPARTPRRVFLWTRRNKAWAATIAVIILAFLAVGLAVTASAQHRANAARRESLIFEAQALKTGSRQADWSQKAWLLLVEAAKIRSDEDLRNQAATILMGLDAKQARRFREFGAEHVAFDPQGTRVLFGGVVSAEHLRLPAQLWDSESSTLDQLPVAEGGPIGFRADGTPLQLVTQPKELLLTDLSNTEVLTRIALPPELSLPQTAETAMTYDGSRVACQGKTKDNKAQLLVWDGTSTRLLQTSQGEATALAFSPDGSLLGASNEDGTVRVWSVKSSEELCAVRCGNMEVACLAFARDRRCTEGSGEGGEEHGWLMAAGDAGGAVSIWDLAARIPRAYCRGSNFNVLSVAFSPDGMTLASAGRGQTRLWDVATGRLLLTARSGDLITGLAFSPDGRRLATSTQPGFSNPEAVVWDLEGGRAGHEYRGLTGQIQSTRFSPDGKLVAALAHDWQIGVWDVSSGFLRHVFMAPRGISADNGAIAISQDSSRLAFTSRNDARLWDLKTGQQIKTWKLADGLADAIAFDSKGRLLSCRMETLSGEPGAMWNIPSDEDPRVCRIRDLLAENENKPLAEIRDFSRIVRGIAAAPDGSCFVIDGIGGKGRMIKVFNTTGKELYEIPQQLVSQFAVLVIDPVSKVMAVFSDEDQRATLWQLASGKPLGKLARLAEALSPEARYWLRVESINNAAPSLWLFRLKDQEPLFRLGLDSPVTSLQPAFDPTGRLLAWGSENGTVNVCDLPMLWKRTAEIYPDW